MDRQHERSQVKSGDSVTTQQDPANILARKKRARYSQPANLTEGLNKPTAAMRARGPGIALIAVTATQRPPREFSWAELAQKIRQHARI